MTDRADLSAIREALAGATAATSSGFDPDRYPGIAITQAPARSRPVDDLINEAFETADWPEFSLPIPLATQLDETQRQLDELVSDHAGLVLHRWAIPQTLRARRRWLGIDPPGILERDIEYEIEGVLQTAPLWRALSELDGTAAADELYETLPTAQRLEAWGDLVFGAYRIDPPWEPESVGTSGRDWAPAFADRLVAMFAPGAPHSERNGYSTAPSNVCRVVTAALVAAEIPIEPRWDVLIPFDLDLIARLPADRRAPVLVRCVAAEFPMWAVKKGIPAIARFPSEPLLEHLIERFDRSYESLSTPPRRELFADLRDAVAKRPELVERIVSHVAGLPPLPALSCGRKSRPRSIDELTEGQRKQFAILGKGWETDDGPMVWEGEDGAIEFGDIDFVSAYEIAGPDGKPAFEALLYMDEDGAVCRAGTTNSVAYACQMRLEWNIDTPTIEAIHAILRERPPRLPRDE